MKNKILSTIIVLLLMIFSGCADKTIILVPQSEYYPTFPTTDFDTSKKYKLEIWEEEEDVNGTTVNYLVAEKTNGLGFIEDTKTLRSNYNLLLTKIIEFNGKIKHLNKIQNEKKPQEVDTIETSWFK